TEAPAPADDPATFGNRPLLLRLLLVLAWPIGAQLFLVGFAVGADLFLGVRASSPEGEVIGVDPAGPASAAGLSAGDAIRAVDGRPGTGEGFRGRVQARGGGIMHLELRRGDRTLMAEVAPRDGKIGISMGPHLTIVPAGLGVALRDGLARPIANEGLIVE